MYTIRLGEMMLPFLPEKLKESRDKDNKTYNVLAMGEVIRPGRPKLRKWEINSIVYDDVEQFKNFLDGLMESSEPTTLIINRRNVDGSMVFDTNVDVIVDSLSYEEKAGEVGDLYYNLKLIEYKEFKAVIK